MNLLRITHVCCLLVTAALAACSTNPAVPAGDSIQSFARSLDGKRFDFELTGRILVPAMSGELVTNQRIPRGLLAALAPATDHCKRAGGELIYTRLQAAGQAQLPLRALCQRDTAPLWALDVNYLDVAQRAGEDANGRKTLQFLGMTMRAEYLSTEVVAGRIRAESEQAQRRDEAAAEQRLRDAEQEQERVRLAKLNELEAQRVAALWPMRVAQFRANLKPGDRFKWVSASLRGGPMVGMVVKVDGGMAFVQFENLTIGGQQTRYVRRDELEPFDGPVPNARYEIK